jgi:hypothetical protein
MARQEQQSDNADEVFDRQRAVYEESYQQRGLSEQDAQREAEEKLEPADRGAERERG